MAAIGDIKHGLIPAIELSKDVSLERLKGFEPVREAAAASPLIEIAPAASGDAAAALGFALAWMKSSQNGLMFWSAPERSFAEHGALYAEGLAQFGIDPRALVLVRTQNQLDALWATEQALTLPCANVLCTIAHSPKSLSLAASRRLLLNAEKSGARAIMLRFDAPAPSAARSRWRISAAASHADDHGFGGRELGAPSFNVQLERNRASPAGQTWRVDWNAHECSFHERPVSDYGTAPNSAANDSKLDGALFAAPVHRPLALQDRRAG